MTRHDTQMAARNAEQADFEIVRTFKASVARVFEAWSNEAKKRAWSDCHADTGSSQFTLDFRQGGVERHIVDRADGCHQVIEKFFLDIVPDSRIVFSYYIRVDGVTISASLVTVEFLAQGSDTRMRYRETVAYFDGHGGHEQRIVGTRDGIEQLAIYLAQPLSS
jgi:uncharacterized protein YndB with AHSA1/START domain